LKSPETCPNCGADVPPRARACPSCGADENTGWADGAHGPEIPDDSFDYQEFVENEFDTSKKPIPRGIHWVWWLVAIVLVTLFLLSFVPWR
jgi:uncharacterized membrane protein YvbJ